MRLIRRAYFGALCRAAIVATLALVVGCSKEDMPQPSSSDTITFEQYNFSDLVTGTATRGSVKSTFNESDDFGAFVYSIESGATAAQSWIMNNQKVTLSDEGVWEYSPAAKWSGVATNTDYMLAYAPFGTSDNGLAVASSNVGSPVITYQMPTVCTNQPDLMVATHSRAGNETSNVSLNFSHQLAAIAFAVKGESSMTLTGVSITGIKDKAYLSYSNSAWTWGSQTNEDGKYSAGINETQPTDKDTATPVTADDGYLMVIPQTTTSSAEVEITCSGSSSTSTAILSLPETTWVAGNKYLYTVTLGVNISIEILQWTEGGDVDDDVSDPNGSVSTDPWDDNDQSDSFSDPDASFNITGWNDYNSELDDEINDPDASVSTDDWDETDLDGSLSDPNASVSTDDWDETDLDGSLSDPNASVSTDSWTETDLDGSLSDPNASVSTDSWTETDLDGSLSDPNAGITADNWTETTLSGEVTD